MNENTSTIRDWQSFVRGVVLLSVAGLGGGTAFLVAHRAQVYTTPTGQYVVSLVSLTAVLAAVVVAAGGFRALQAACAGTNGQDVDLDDW